MIIYYKSPPTPSLTKIGNGNLLQIFVGVINDRPHSKLMADDPHHEHLVKELREQLAPVFDNSPQAIYLYLDDEHKICNQKFADLLGYKSVQEWVDNQYPVEDIRAEDQPKVVSAYMDVSQDLKSENLKANGITKDGREIEMDITMVPITYKDEVFVMHFINSRKNSDVTKNSTDNEMKS